MTIRRIQPRRFSAFFCVILREKKKLRASVSCESNTAHTEVRSPYSLEGQSVESYSGNVQWLERMLQALSPLSCW